MSDQTTADRLLGYVQHRVECAVWDSNGAYRDDVLASDCTCGLTALLAEAERLSTPPPDAVTQADTLADKHLTWVSELADAIHPTRDEEWTIRDLANLARAHRQDSELVDAAEAGVGTLSREDAVTRAKLEMLDEVECEVVAMRERPGAPTLGQLQRFIADKRARLKERRCQKCSHLWGAYEDTCHCNGPCHNRDACAHLKGTPHAD